MGRVKGYGCCKVKVPWSQDAGEKQRVNPIHGRYSHGTLVVIIIIIIVVVVVVLPQTQTSQIG